MGGSINCAIDNTTDLTILLHHPTRSYGPVTLAEKPKPIAVGAQNPWFEMLYTSYFVTGCQDYEGCGYFRDSYCYKYYPAPGVIQSKPVPLRTLAFCLHCVQ